MIARGAALDGGTVGGRSGEVRRERGEEVRDPVPAGCYRSALWVRGSRQS